MPAIDEISLNDVLGWGDERGETPETIARGVQKWHALSYDYGDSKLGQDDSETFFEKAKQLDAATESVLGDLRRKAVQAYVTEQFPEDEARQAFADEYERTQGDPTGINDAYFAKVAEGLNRDVLGNPLYRTPGGETPKASIYSGETPIAEYKARRRADGGADVLVTAKDKDGADVRGRVRVDLPDDMDVEAEIARLEQESAGLAKDLEVQSAPIESPLASALLGDGAGVVGDSVNAIDQQLTRTRNRIAELKQGGVGVLLSDRVHDAVKASPIADKLGDSGVEALIQDASNGLTKFLLGTRVAFNDITGDTEERDAVAAQLAAVDKTSPGSTGSRFRGGVAGFASEAVETVGNVYPTIALGAVTGGESAAAQATGRTVTLGSMAPNAYGNALADAQSTAKRKEAQAQTAALSGDSALASQLRAQAADILKNQRGHALASTAIEIGTELMFRGDELFRRGGAVAAGKRVATATGENIVEESVAEVLGQELAATTLSENRRDAGQVLRAGALGAVIGAPIGAVGGIRELMLNRAIPGERITADDIAAGRERISTLLADESLSEEDRTAREAARTALDGTLPQPGRTEQEIEAEIADATAEGDTVKVAELATDLAQAQAVAVDEDTAETLPPIPPPPTIPQEESAPAPLVAGPPNEFGERFVPGYGYVFPGQPLPPGVVEHGSSTELDPKTPQDALTYEEFVRQYEDAFKRANSYTEKQVGQGIMAEKMAKLADENPGHLARLEAEQEAKAKEPTSKDKPEVAPAEPVTPEPAPEPALTSNEGETSATPEAPAVEPAPEVSAPKTPPAPVLPPQATAIPPKGIAGIPEPGTPVPTQEAEPAERTGIISDEESARLDGINASNLERFNRLSENQFLQLAVNLGLRPNTAKRESVLANTHPEDLRKALDETAPAVTPKKKATRKRRSPGKGVDASLRPPTPDARTRSRASHLYDVFVEEGLDPDAATLLPPAKQFAIAAKNLQRNFGFREILRAGLNFRDAIDQMMDMRAGLQDMAAALGIPMEAIGLNKSIALDFANAKRGALGWYDDQAKSITNVERNDVFGHEWAHALDYFLLDNSEVSERKREGSDRGATGARRDRNTVDEIFGGILDDNFNALARALFQDNAAEAIEIARLKAKIARSKSPKQIAKHQEQIERIKRGASHKKGLKSKFQSEAERVDPLDASGYYQRPTEMLARAFEAYIAERIAAMGGTPVGIVDTERVAQFPQMFPHGAERNAVFSAIDGIMAGLSGVGDFKGAKANTFKAANLLDPDRWPARTPEQRGWKQFWKKWVDEERSAFSTWYAQRKRRKALPGDGRTVPQALQDLRMQGMSAIRAQFNGLMHRYKGQRRIVAGIRAIKDLVTTSPGERRLVREPFQEEAERESNRKDNRLTRAFLDHGFRWERMTEDQLAELRQTLLHGDEHAKSDAMKATAARIRRLIDAEYRLNRNNGHENIDYNGNSYLPRIYKWDAAFNDPEGFKAAAKEVYLVMQQPEIEAITNNDELDAKQKDAALLEIELATEKQASEWWTALVYGGELEFFRAGPESSYLKKRVLPPEADDLMEPYLVNDPIEASRTFLHNSSRRIAFTRRFGSNGEKLNELFGNLIDAGIHPHDKDMLARMVDSATGRAQFNTGPSLAKALSFTHMLGTVVMLPKAPFSSVAEPFVIALRTGRTLDFLRVVYQTVADLAKTSNARQIAELTEFLGVLGDPTLDHTMSNRFGGGFLDSKRNSATLTTFFRRTLLTPLTRHQQRVATRMGVGYLQHLSRRMQGKGRGVEDARGLLNELGISDPDAFAKWMLQRDGDALTINGLEGDPMRLEFGTAVARFVRQSIQNPTATDRPLAANNPVGRVIFAITGFNVSFYENVIKGTAKRAASAPGGGRKLAAFANLLPAMGSLVLGNLVMGAVRSALTNRERWDQEDGDTFLEKMFNARSIATALTRSFPLGTADTFLIQPVLGLKFRRPISQSLAGAHASYALVALERIFGLLNSRSPNNNTAERKAMQGIYEIGLLPMLNVALSRAPGGPLLEVLYGAAMMAGSSATVRDAFLDKTVGEKYRFSPTGRETAEEYGVSADDLRTFTGKDSFTKSDVIEYLRSLGIKVPK